MAVEQLPFEIEKDTGFRVTNRQELTWAMRKLVALQAEENEVREITKVEIDRIKQFEEKELRKISDSRAYFNALISEYAVAKRNEDSKFKRETTPYGSIGYKKQQTEWVYNDEKLIQHLKENDLKEYIRVTEEPNKADIKKSFSVKDEKVYDSNGQEVEGITLNKRPDVLDIKVGE